MNSSVTLIQLGNVSYTDNVDPDKRVHPRSLILELHRPLIKRPQVFCYIVNSGPAWKYAMFGKFIRAV